MFKVYNLIVLTYVYICESIAIIKIINKLVAPKTCHVPLFNPFLPPLPATHPLVLSNNCWSGFCPNRLVGIFLEFYIHKSYIVCSLFCLTSAHQNNWDSSMLLCVLIVQYFYCWVLFHCMDVPCFVHLFTDWKIFGLFPVVVIMKSYMINIHL